MIKLIKSILKFAVKVVVSLFKVVGFVVGGALALVAGIVSIPIQIVLSIFGGPSIFFHYQPWSQR